MLVAAVSVLFLYGAIGMMLATWLASPPTGPGFWRLLLLLAIAAGALGVGLRTSSLSQTLPPLGITSLVALAIAMIGIVALGARKGIDSDRPYPLLLALSALPAGVALLADPALYSPTATGFSAVVYSLGIGSSALALGGVIAAMLLAHWYLIQPRMPIAPLQRVLALFVGVEFLKLLLLIAVITIHWPEWTASEGGLMRSFVLGDALFVAVRAVLGVLSPLGLAWMTWKTVQIRSIQSATGILYAAIVFVLFGEVISVYLSLSTGLPF